jgi:Leucine-rich repeat (LRR) protein
LKELPTFIDNLIGLENLDLSRCSELKELPTSVDKLITLQSLNLSGCLELMDLPTSIDKLTALSIIGFVKVHGVYGVDGITCIY